VFFLQHQAESAYGVYMPRSMTGFGSGKIDREGRCITVELRSVNNRFLELSFRLPRSLYSLESELRDTLRSRLQRGRVSVSVSEERNPNHVPSIRIDRGRAKSYAEALRGMQSDLGIGGDIQLDHLLSIGDLLSTEETDDDRQQLCDMTREALSIAIDELVEVSSIEGKNLGSDLRSRMDQFLAEKEIIVKHIDGMINQYRDRLTQRLEEVLTDNRIDPTRLETEIAIVADKLDISEEIVRLDSHISLFSETLSKENVVGKKLGFILQEMGRETNTISSKSWLVEVSQTAIRMKEILEQVREQVQNLE
jgi:uncharacterized protein (TIGR00255 family)